MAEVTDAEIVRPSVRDRVKSFALVLVSPEAIAPVCLLAGIGLAVAGVYILAGIGWALVAGSVPLLLLSAILIRGLIRG